jgi:hypothetical protein
MENKTVYFRLAKSISWKYFHLSTIFVKNAFNVNMSGIEKEESENRIEYV